MKNLLAALFVSFSLISCMEVEKPVCHNGNAIDIPNLPSQVFLNSYGQKFELNQTEQRIKRIGRGLIEFNGSGSHMRTCEVGGKTLVQTKTPEGTYQLFSMNIGRDSMSFVPYMIDREILDFENIRYEIVTRETDEELAKYTQQKSITQQVLVVEEIPTSLVPKLLVQVSGLTFSH